MKMTFVPFAVAACATLGLCAQAADKAPAPKPVQLSVEAAAVPEPALQYSLTVPAADQVSGNAAPIYLAAFLHLRLTPEERQHIDELFAAPREKFQVAEANKLLEPHAQYFSGLDLAARRGHCDWEIPYREQGISTLLPHLEPCRQAVRLLSLKARMQMMEGHFDPALQTLQTGFALVAHLKNDACLVQALVAIAATGTLLDRVEELQQMKGAPNLYWTLAGLPRPLVDMRAVADVERYLVWDVVPLGRRSPGPLSADESAALLKRMQQLMLTTEFEQKVRAAVIVAQATGAARKWLQTLGYTEKQVDEMPPIQAVGGYFLATYEKVSDDLQKWTRVPYWQARDGLAAAELEFRQLAGENANPLLQLLPGMSRICLRAALVERRIAILQTIEALRAFAAAHDGKLPAALVELKETPAPVDPLTGKVFEYETSDGLHGASLASPGEEAPVYVITVSK